MIQFRYKAIGITALLLTGVLLAVLAGDREPGNEADGTDERQTTGRDTTPVARPVQPLLPEALNSDSISYDYAVYYDKEDGSSDSINGRLVFHNPSFFDSNTHTISQRYGAHMMSIDKVNRQAAYMSEGKSRDIGFPLARMAPFQELTDSLYAVALLDDKVAGRRKVTADARSVQCLVKHLEVIYSLPEGREPEVESISMMLNTALLGNGATDTDIRVKMTHIRTGQAAGDLQIDRYFRVMGTEVSLQGAFRDYKIISL